jgi:endonuclease YncB( thermonuclease family)
MVGSTKFSVFCMCLFVGCLTAHAQTLAGRAVVVHADTLEIHGERIRLLDIDAPDSQQTCARPDGTEWRCGQEAVLKLADWIGQRTVTCEAGRKDRYGRWLANCMSGGEDIARWLASRGWAVPYRNCKCGTIREASESAKSLQRGMWAGTFVMPWVWRELGPES